MRKWALLQFAIASLAVSGCVSGLRLAEQAASTNARETKPIVTRQVVRELQARRKIDPSLQMAVFTKLPVQNSLKDYPLEGVFGVRSGPFTNVGHVPAYDLDHLRSIENDQAVGDLINTIKKEVEPKSWTQEGRWIGKHPTRPGILIYQKPNVIRKVASFLDEQRRNNRRSRWLISQETAILLLPVDGAARVLETVFGKRVDLEQNTIVPITKEQSEALRQSEPAELLGSPRLTSYAGQKAHMWVAERKEYISEYVEYVLNGMTMTRPVEESTVEGVGTWFRTTLSKDRKTMKVNLRLFIHELEEMTEKETLYGKIQTPIMTKTKIEHAWEQPADRYSLLIGPAHRGKLVLLILDIRLLGLSATL